MVAAEATPPPSQQAQSAFSHRTANTPGAALYELSQDCEIVVKLRDPAVIDRLQGKNSAEIRP